MLYSILKSYSFHDTVINKIDLVKEGIILYLDQGLFMINSSNNISQTPPCKVTIHIHNFDKDKVFQHVEIKKQYKIIAREISFDTFMHMLKRNVFKVYLDYYCLISKSVKMEGLIGKYSINMTISDIKSINIVYMT